MAEPQAQLPWVLLRDAVSSADTDLTATTKNWATFKSTYHPRATTPGIAKELTRQHKYVSICFDFATATTDTCALSLYAYRDGGCAEFICSIDTVTAGNQEADMRGGGSTTRYFGDEIGTITQRWPDSSASVTEADSGGNNGVAKLDFDARGYKFLLILFTTIGAGSVRAWFTGIS